MLNGILAGLIGTTAGCAYVDVMGRNASFRDINGTIDRDSALISAAVLEQNVIRDHIAESFETLPEFNQEI